jgi:hypothetical protein
VYSGVMGTSIYASVVVGAPVSSDELSTSITEVHYKCDSCERSHKAGLKFCGGCGHRLKEVTRTELRRHVLDLGYDDISDILVNVRAVSSSEDNKAAITAVVEELLEASAWYEKSETKSVTLEQITEAAEKVRATLRELGLNDDRPVQLYLKMYVSC